MIAQQLQSFGGSWTQEKLNKLRRYLIAYKTALKNQPFQLIYIDAFAGTGYRDIANSDSADREMFAELIGPEPQEFLDGSVRIALKIDPPFNKYIFIELSEERFSKLNKIKAEFPELANCIQLIKGDCNIYLQKLCKTNNWKEYRAVLFLDPFGMQVDWKTMEAVAATKAIDVWILFPLGIGVNRLLTKNGEIPLPWRSRLNRLFGTEEWFNRFYKEEESLMLWGKEATLKKVADFDQIANFYIQRLRTIFAGVANNPLKLLNSKGSPLFLLCFAAGNPRGSKIAIRIAQHILKG